MGSTGRVSAGSTGAVSGGELPVRRKDKDEYKTFDSRHSDTHNYERDGGATNRWFLEHSNAQELYDEINKDRDEWLAFDHTWVYGHFMDGQQYEGFSKMDKEDQDATRIYDKYLDRSTINTPFVVHRRATAELLLGKGNRTATEEDIQRMIGQEIYSRGNMSTGAAREGLTIGSNKQIEYEIRVPSGTGYGMWLGNDDVNSYYGDRQREFMLNRDLILMPVSYERVGGSGRAHGRAEYRVVLEVVRRIEHDYS